MKTQVEIKLTPEQVADAIWALDSFEQAKMFEGLLKCAGNEHRLMMQFLSVRDECQILKMAGKPEAMDCFQSMFASAYKYAWQA